MENRIPEIIESVLKVEKMKMQEWTEAVVNCDQIIWCHPLLRIVALKGMEVGGPTIQDATHPYKPIGGTNQVIYWNIQEVIEFWDATNWSNYSTTIDKWDFARWADNSTRMWVDEQCTNVYRRNPAYKHPTLNSFEPTWTAQRWLKFHHETRNGCTS